MFHKLDVGQKEQNVSECVGKLKEEFEDYRIPLNDDNKELHRFCAKLEFLLQAGMKRKSPVNHAKNCSVIVTSSSVTYRH